MAENLDNTAMPKHLIKSEQQCNRLWEHLLHVETQIYARMTLFLVIETLLLATVGTMYSKPAPLHVLLAIVILGLCITIIWVYLGHRVKKNFDAVHKRALIYLPEYKETEDEIGTVRWPLRSSTSYTPSIPILTYIIPFLFAVLWFYLLIFLH